MRQLVIDTGHFRAYLIKNHMHWNGRTVIEIEERFADMVSAWWCTMLTMPLDTYLRIGNAALPGTVLLPESVEEAVSRG